MSEQEQLQPLRMADGLMIPLYGKAEAEVVKNPHAEECVAEHPGEVCPGYPHTAPKEG